MAWMKYNKETKKVARAAVLVSDLEKFDSIVMDNATWSAINTFSDRVPWGRHSRMNTFVDDLLDELKRKEAETDEPFSSQPSAECPVMLRKDSQCIMSFSAREST